jgi:hypothetical protein
MSLRRDQTRPSCRQSESPHTRHGLAAGGRVRSTCLTGLLIAPAELASPERPGRGRRSAMALRSDRGPGALIIERPEFHPRIYPTDAPSRTGTRDATSRGGLALSFGKLSLVPGTPEG